jgi:hypothetical protein
MNSSYIKKNIFDSGESENNLYPEDLFYSETSVISTIMTIVIGILIGVVIGYFVFRNIKYVGPDSNLIVKKVYKDEKGRYYKYKPVITICPMNYSMNKLHDPNFQEQH